MGMSHFSDIDLPQMEPTFIPGVGRGGDSAYERVGNGRWKF